MQQVFQCLRVRSKQTIVRNGYLPERSTQTGLGDISQNTEVRDRSSQGIRFNVRMDDRRCLLVIVGSDETGRKEVLAVVDGYQESEAIWLEMIEQLENQGLSIPPLLAVADGALVFLEGGEEMTRDGERAK